MNYVQTLPLGRYLDVETARYLTNSVAADTTEGALAFLHKRPAVYAGH